MNVNLRRPDIFYLRYIQDFGNLSTGPGLIEIPLHWSQAHWTHRCFTYYERLAKENGFICRFEYRHAGTSKLDACWYPRNAKPKSSDSLEIYIEQEWELKTVETEMRTLIKVPAYLKVLVSNKVVTESEPKVQVILNKFKEIIKQSRVDNEQTSYLFLLHSHANTTWIDVQGFVMDRLAGIRTQWEPTRFELHSIER
jgi:hypothetical protein